MKTITKSILAAAAIVAASANVNAGVHPAYIQNYDAVANVAGTGFTTTRGTLSLVDNGNGKALSYALGQNNGSSAYVYWGTEAWVKPESKDNGVDNYYFSTDFSYSPGNNQAGGVFAVLSQTPQAEGATLPHGININWFTAADTLFYMASTAANSAEFLALSPKTAEDTAAYSVSLTAATWYNLSLMINKDTRAVKATIKLLSDDSVVKEINYTIPEKSLDIVSIATNGAVTRAETEHEINMLPTGIFLVANRYQSTWVLDNTVVGKYVDGVVPQTPAATLVDANNKYREYKLGWNAGETLNYKVTGDLAVALKRDVDTDLAAEGSYEYDLVEASENLFDFFAASETANSGSLEIWTTAGAFESEHVTVNIAVEEIKLPAPDAQITAVSEGYTKTFLVTVDNSEVPTQPNLSFNYVFTPADGSEPETKENLDSGTKVTIDKAGTLTLQTVAENYTASEKVVKENDKAYEKSKVLDFEHMTAAELEALGFVALDPIQSTSMSGENNWSARLRLYDFIGTDGDSTVYYGPDYQLKRKITNGEWEAIVEGTDYPKLERYEWQKEGAALLANEIDSTQAMLFAPLYFPNKDQGYGKANTFQVKLGVGLLNNETAQTNVPYAFRGMEEGEFALVYKINGYGANSTHGYFASVEEAKASNHGELTDVVSANGSFELYRIDTAISLIEIMSVKKDDGGETGEGGNTEEPGGNTEEPGGNTEEPGGNTENPTPVKTIYANGEVSGVVYDLLGRKVDTNNIKPGIYIQDGKKIVVK